VKEKEKQSTQLVSVMAENHLMSKYDFWTIMRESIFPKDMTDEQAMVFLAVANALSLNPLNGEIYPMITKGRVLPLVGVDGWIKRANRHPEFDGMTIDMSGDFNECTITIYRKDRSHPIIVTEYLSECRKDTGPWRSHPRRMLRHRTIIQGVRICFGSGGAVDEDDRHYYEADAHVVATPKTSTVERTKELKEELEQAVEVVTEKDMMAFVAVPKMTCSADGCRKRLVRLCKSCLTYNCSDHWDIVSDQCFPCMMAEDAKQDEPEGDTGDVPVEAELANEPDLVDQLVDTAEQENTEQDAGPELPWD